MKEASGTPIDLPYMLSDSLGNVVNEIIFGYKYPSDDKTWKWFRQIQEEGCHEMGVAGAVNFLPFVRYVLELFLVIVCFLIILLITDLTLEGFSRHPLGKQLKC